MPKFRKYVYEIRSGGKWVGMAGTYKEAKRHADHLTRYYNKKHTVRRVAG